ncbi:MAG: PfkB family carbohydrate kinase [Sulfitobacter sp.]
MSEILTVTVNPAIDLATSAERVQPDRKLRCGPARVDPGGGGINVARTIVKLGGDAKAVIAVGGTTGEQLISMVRADGVTPIAVPVTGQTRQNLAVTDRRSGEQYRFSLLSDRWSGTDEANMIEAIKLNASRDGFVVLSGGLAHGMAIGFHGQIQTELRAITSKIIIDTCETALSHLMAHTHTPFHVLRIDQHEATMAAGHDLGAITDGFQFGAALIGRGVAEIVVIGRGAKGSLLVSRDRRMFCHATKVPVRSKIGAGDAFVGGLTLSLSRAEPLERALQWGVAAACATVKTDGTALCTLQEVEALLPRCRVEAFAP